MEYNPLSFLDDLVSTRGYEANEKLKRLHGESFGPYTIHASYYNGETEILTLWLTVSDGRMYRWDAVAKPPVFNLRDDIFLNHLWISVRPEHLRQV